MKATFCPLKRMPSSTATAPNTTVAMRATRTCSSSVACPFRTTCRKMSCDSALAPASVSPATTARIVAKATAAMKPRNGVPPRSSATQRRGHVAARVDPANRVAADQRRRAEADDRDDQVEVADEAGGVEHRRARRLRVAARCRTASGCAAGRAGRTSAPARATRRRPDR